MFWKLSQGVDRGAGAATESAPLVAVHTPTDNEGLPDHVWAKLEALFPRARQARIERFLVTRERTATFHQGPGTAALRPEAPTKLPGVFLAGAWTDTGWPATMEGAVRSGLAAARAVLEDAAVPVAREVAA